MKPFTIELLYIPSHQLLSDNTLSSLTYFLLEQLNLARQTEGFSRNCPTRVIQMGVSCFWIGEL